MLNRRISKYIEDFYENSNSALLITGARQTGKTYSIRQFGKKFSNFIEINFIDNKSAAEIFSGSNSAADILLRLSAFTETPLVKGETLIFFDEVQACEDIITAIKFLVDEGSYRYIMSGSLLGVELKDIRSVPVGYLGIKGMYPLDFLEFITNLGMSYSLLEYLEKCYQDLTPVDEVVHDRLMKAFRLYTIVGGMPAAVAAYVESNNLQNVLDRQRYIVDLYRWDISQYAAKDKLKIKEIFDLIPSELDAKNKRFIIKSLNAHAKYDRYKDEFLWLKDAGVAIPVYNVEEPKVPLRLAETRNLFKLFSNDVGLLAAQYSNGLQLKILQGEVDVNFGSVFENVVAQELVAHGFTPYYYNNKRRGEIDFLVTIGGEVVPIEVKSGKDYARHNALANIMAYDEYNISKAYVLCNGNIQVKEKIVYLPIYLMMFIKPHDNVGLGIYKLDLSGL